MKKIGLKVDSLPFELNKFEGILLFQEYPTTIIYEDIYGNPIIKEWVDVSDDYLTNQYYYYKTSRILLKQFVEGNLPHAELINLAIDSVVYYEDSTENIKSEYRFSPVTWIPPEHKPNVDFYFPIRRWG